MTTIQARKLKQIVLKVSELSLKSSIFRMFDGSIKLMEPNIGASKIPNIVEMI